MIECLDCGHNESDHSRGEGPIWPCLIPDCECSDVVYKRPAPTKPPTDTSWIEFQRWPSIATLAAALGFAILGTLVCVGIIALLLTPCR